MDYKEIEILKLALMNLARRGSKIRIKANEIDGKVVGIGFKPYWTGPNDSKIEKLEINYIDAAGKLKTYNINAITGYDVISNDGRSYDSIRNACIDLHILSTGKKNNTRTDEKLRLELYSEKSE